MSCCHEALLHWRTSLEHPNHAVRSPRLGSRGIARGFSGSCRPGGNLGGMPPLIQIGVVALEAPRLHVLSDFGNIATRAMHV